MNKNESLLQSSAINKLYIDISNLIQKTVDKLPEGCRESATDKILEMHCFDFDYTFKGQDAPDLPNVDDYDEYWENLLDADVFVVMEHGDDYHGGSQPVCAWQDKEKAKIDAATRRENQIPGCDGSETCTHKHWYTVNELKVMDS